MNQDQPNITQKVSGSSHTGIITVLGIGLLLALGGDAYLLSRSNNLDAQVTQVKQDAQAQIAKLSDTTTDLLTQERQQLQALNDDVSGKYDTANTALRKARVDAKKASEELSAKISEQQKAVGEELGQLKEATTSATSKLNDDVSGVKTDVGAVRTDLSATRSDLDKTGADLKRAIGDMGVMSGLIATNSKDLQTLRELGERNYFEFDLGKGAMTKKVGDMTLTLKKSRSEAQSLHRRGELRRQDRGKTRPDHQRTGAALYQQEQAALRDRRESGEEGWSSRISSNAQSSNGGALEERARTSYLLRSGEVRA